MTELHITGDAKADALLSSNPLALLVGMLLDQQMLMETAFAGPEKIRERLGRFDAKTLADTDPEQMVAIFKEPPAVHRYPGSMAGRTQELATAVVDDWGGDASAIWTRGDPGGAEVLRRLEALPGFGAQKSKIFLTLLGKRLGFTGAGWQAAAGDYAKGGHRSVADVTDAESLQLVREHKQAQKAAAKAAKG